MMDPPPFESVVPGSPFPGLPDYASSSFKPEILVQPLEDRISFLDDRQVSGLVYVKGVGHEWQLDRVEIRLRLSDEMAGLAPQALFCSKWYQVMAADVNAGTSNSGNTQRPAFASEQSSGSTQARISEKRREAEGDQCNHSGLPFSIDLQDHEQFDHVLPGCIHLLQAGLGQVVWRIEIRAKARQAGIMGDSPSAVAEHVDDFDIHLTPCRRPDVHAYMSDSEAGPSGTSLRETSSTISGNLPHVAASACRMTLNMTDVVNTESVAVGVDISSDPRGMSDQAIKWLRGLRSVRIQWWRRVRVRQGEVQQSSHTSRQSDATDYKDSLTLLHKSGKLCRYSNNAERPIRLVFELPPLHNVIFKTHSAASIGGVGCGDISQETPLHLTEFFIRVIVESRGGGGASTPSQQATSSTSTMSTAAPLLEGDPVVIEHAIKILPPTWDQVMPYIVTSADQHSSSDSAAIARAIEENGDLQDFSKDSHQADARHRAYRLKGSDVVGDTGTFRQESSGPSGSGPSPPAFDEAAFVQPPSASNILPADPPPFTEVIPQSDEALPSFDESEQSRHERPRVHEVIPGGVAPAAGSSATHPTPADPLRNPRSAIRSGVLANWREYDGYETFSAPPPAASVSLGLSGSMDPPSSYDAEAEPGHGDTTLGGVDQRAMLLEQLGLGEGTRVIDTHEDMPPGFDEPSLPSLPNAVMPHHRRGILRRTAMDEAGGANTQVAGHNESSPPPAFSPDANSRTEPIAQGSTQATGNNSDRTVLPPPSFDASEAAEARGIAATGPEPVMLNPERTPVAEPSRGLPYDAPDGMAPAPPVYTMDHHEAPPGYSRGSR